VENLNTFGPLTLTSIIHDIRLLGAVWCPEPGRFHPDQRDHDAPIGRGLLGAFRSFAAATVILENGDVVRIERSRSHERAAAAAAIRSLRSGHRVPSVATVGRLSYSVDIDLPHGNRQQDNASERSDATVVMLTASEIALLSDYQSLNIDAHAMHGATKTADGKIVPCFCGRAICEIDQTGADAETREMRETRELLAGF